MGPITCGCLESLQMNDPRRKLFNQLDRWKEFNFKELHKTCPKSMTFLVTVF